MVAENQYCIFAENRSDITARELTHNDYRLNLIGDSMRKVHSPLKRDPTERYDEFLSSVFSLERSF